MGAFGSAFSNLGKFDKQAKTFATAVPAIAKPQAEDVAVKLEEKLKDIEEGPERQRKAAREETINLLRKRPGRDATILTGPAVTQRTGTAFPFITR